MQYVPMSRAVGFPAAAIVAAAGIWILVARLSDAPSGWGLLPAQVAFYPAIGVIGFLSGHFLRARNRGSLGAEVAAAGGAAEARAETAAEAQRVAERAAAEAHLARRAAEAMSLSLRKERDFAEAVLNNLGALVVALDKEGRVRLFNKACERLSGYAASEVIGQPLWKSLTPSEDLGAASGRWEAFKSGRFPSTCETRWMTRSGQRRHIAWTNTAIRGQDGTVEYTVGTGRDITERGQAGGDPAVGENCYSNLFANMSEGVALHEIVCDQNGEPVDYRFVDVNPAYERLTGLRRDQLVGNCASAAGLGNGLIGARAAGAVALTGKPRRFEHTVHDTGRCLEVNVYSPARRQFAVILTDISEVVHAREKEKESVATLTAARTAMDALDAMGQGLIVTDSKGVIRLVNRTMVGLGGYGVEEVVGQPLVQILRKVVLSSELPAMISDLDVSLKGQPVPDRIVTFVAKDGRRISVSPGLSLIRAPGGRTNGLVLTVRDLSELQESHSAMVESERKYRELVESANSIIMRWKADGTITFFNEYAQRFFGYEEGEAVGRNVGDTIERRVGAAGEATAVMFTKVGADPDLHAAIEIENVRRDGRRAWVHWTHRAIRDSRGHILEILSVGSDITERKRMEAENRLYQERLRALAEKLATTEEQERWRISRHIHDSIVQNLALACMRLGDGSGREREAGDARALVAQAINECRLVMADLTPALLYELGLVAALDELARGLEEKHGSRIVVRGDPDDPPMSDALRGLLFHSVRELLVNALKHAGRCDIDVDVRYRGYGVVITVRDNGAGFETSETEKTPGRRGGFGLFAVRQRVEGLGGRVTIESAPGQGVVASITLPIKAFNAVPAAARA